MDRSEFERIAPALRIRIVALVERIVCDNGAGQADDVAQDTLLRLWTMRDRLDDYSSLEALAMVMARNMAIDMIRKNHGVAVSLDEAVTRSVAPTPHDLLAEKEDARTMDAILAALPSAQRALIRMRHEEGMEISHIAAAICSSEGAVRVALSRARRHVMDLFKTKSNE